MAIVIQPIPPFQVLNETLDATSYLSLFVTGLQDPTVFYPTAILDQNGGDYFDDSPDVISVTALNGQFLVILELLGTVDPFDGEFLKVVLSQAKGDQTFDPDITVTICQDNVCSQSKAVVAIFLTPPDINGLKESPAD